MVRLYNRIVIFVYDSVEFRISCEIIKAFYKSNICILCPSNNISLDSKGYFFIIYRFFRNLLFEKNFHFWMFLFNEFDFFFI